MLRKIFELKTSFISMTVFVCSRSDGSNLKVERSSTF